MAKEIGKKFAVFDIDGTLIRWQLYHAIADALVKRGYIDAGDYAAIRDARMLWKKRSHPESFHAYEQQLVRLYGKFMTSLSVANFNEAARAVFDEYKEQAYTYTRDLITELKKQDYRLLAISGSQTEIVKLIAGHYGFDGFVASTYHHSGSRFTGEVTLPFKNKDVALKQLVAKYNLTMKDSVAVGDSLSDAKMLEMVERPIAFNPERKLFDYAKSRGWDIVVERKNVVYKLRASGGKYELA